MLEVVVVDDGSADVRAVERVVETHEGVQLVRLDGRGPAAARNAGIRTARADVVLLTDDDCVPAPGWAAALAAAVGETGMPATYHAVRAAAPPARSTCGRRR